MILCEGVGVGLSGGCADSGLDYGAFDAQDGVVDGEEISKGWTLWPPVR